METPPRQPPPGTPRPPGALPPPATLRDAQFVHRQQRFSIPQLIFLSIVFFILSNNGNEVSSAERTTVEQLEAALARREMRRGGLAQWLGINGTYTSDNGTNLTQEFEVVRYMNDAVLPLAQKLVSREGVREQLFFPQNLTGFVKGTWDPGHWTYADLELEETYNVTTLVEKPDEPVVGNKGVELVREVDGGVVAEDKPVTEGSSALVRRQVEGSLGGAGVSTNSTPPARVTVNQTTTYNRTELKSYFDFAKGGKVTFNLREEQIFAVGPVIVPNVGEDPGTLLRVREGQREDWEEHGPVVYLRGDLILSSNDGATDLSLELESVHFLSLGTVYGFASASSDPSWIFRVPSIPFSLNPNSTQAQAAGHSILVELDRRINQDRNELASFLNTQVDYNPPPLPPCDFLLVGQLAPLPSHYSQSAYAEYYASLFHPTGASLHPPPSPEFSYMIYSERCGLLIQGEGEGLASPRLWTRATNLGFTLALTQAVLVWLLVRQMETGSSAASSAKVAYFTVGMQTLMDAYFFIITFTTGVVTNNQASLPILVPSFLALISSLLFGMRYTTNIRSAAPSPPRPPPPPPPPTREELAAQAAERRASGAPEVAASSPVVPGSTPPVNANNDVGSTLFGLAVAISAILFIVFWGWMPLLALLLYSYWVPQILLNVQRGAARLALRKEYVVGTTICRLVLPGYLWGCKTNLLSVQTSPWVYALFLYSGLQATILLLQDSRLGARFFLPAGVLGWFGIKEEDSWDYHPLLPYSDIEGDAARLEDCPICMEPIDQGDKEDRELGLQGKARWGYMVTPCHHVCHTECLESWMQIKNVCPVCRGRLPSL